MKRLHLVFMVSSLLAATFSLCGSALAQSSDALLVDENGRVGIGTTSPSAPLHVYGAGADMAVIEQSASPGVAVLTIIGDRMGASKVGGLHFDNRYLSGGQIAGIDAWRGSTQSKGLLIFNTNDGTILAERMRINETGSVGIGTTNQFGGGQGVLSIGNAVSNPTSAPTNAAIFYASGGEMHVRDAGGNDTVISPHPSSDIEMLAEQSDPYPLFGKCTNTIIGKELVIDKGKAFRLLQTLFPNERFMWYRDVPRVDVMVQQREEWKKEWIAKNTTEQEVPKDEALEAVEVLVEDTTKVVSEKVTYALEGRNVMEVRTPIYAQKAEQKWQLKSGARFDTNTGKFFMKKEPTEADAEAAASTQFQLVVRKWIRDRM
jgi:hypothetical protein